MAERAGLLHASGVAAAQRPREHRPRGHRWDIVGRGVPWESWPPGLSLGDTRRPFADTGAHGCRIVQASSLNLSSAR